MKVIMPKPDPKPGFKVVRKRDYSMGSIRDEIAAAESLEELEEVRRKVVVLLQHGRISSGTKRKLERAGAARYAQLKDRESVLSVPGLGGRHRTKGGLIV